MNRLQLATLLSWAGDDGLKGRKRLQKVVFLLQEAGCPLDCRYTLHHFGPYSRDVADRSDEMVAGGLIVENIESANGVLQYAYTLTPATQELLAKMPDSGLQPFANLGKRLINENLWQLELGSTILFFYNQRPNWENAMEEACAFKKVDPGVDWHQKALALAKLVKGQAGH